MIDRLQDVLPYLEQLPPEAQEEAATYIEALAQVLRKHGTPNQTQERQIEEPWEDPAGAWSDLPDTMLDELDMLRHASPPTRPLELL